MSRLHLLLCCASAALVWPGTALATDYCVPTGAACPGAGTPVADLPTALSNAAAATDSDRIYLAAITFTAPTTSGFDYNAPTSPVQVIGAGSTTLTGPTGSTKVLRLLGGSNSAISHLRVTAPDSTPASSRVLEAGNTAVSDVVVDATATQSHPFISVQLDDGSSFADGSVSGPLDQGGNAVGIAINGTGASVARSTVNAGVGVSMNSGSVLANLDRLVLNVSVEGVEDDGATMNLSHSLVNEADNACALHTLDQPSTDAVLNVDGVTVIGAGGGSKAACASSIFSSPRTSTVNVTNSILYPYASSSFASANGGHAAVVITYTDFDPSQEIITGANASFTPAGGLVGATNTNANPHYVGASDFHLDAISPLIDLGDPATAAGLDLDGDTLLYDGSGDCHPRRDMGAYERQVGAVTCPPPPDPPAQDPPADPTPPAGGGDGTGGSPPGTPSAGTPGAGTPPAVTPPVVTPTVRCVVPKLRGLTRRGAARRLRRAHCALGKVKRPRHAHGRLVVARQGAKPGARLAAGSRVAVRLRAARARPRRARAGRRG